MIECINFAITDRCNRSCPECCCNVNGIKDNWDISREEIEEIADLIGRVKRLTLTGGEPSMHPGFSTIVFHAKDVFDCGSFEIETNGSASCFSNQVLSLFDRISVTNYGDNKDQIQDLFGFGTTHCDPKPIQHVPRSRRGNLPCIRGSFQTVSVYKGRIYPCCMGWGIPEAKSIPVSRKWREEIILVERPCQTCFFAL